MSLQISKQTLIQLYTTSQENDIKIKLETKRVPIYCVQVVDVPRRVQLLLNVISLVCVSAKRTMMVHDVTGADLVTTAIQDVSNVLVTLEVQFTSSVIQTQGSVTAKEVSVVLTVIGVLADIMGFLIVKLVSAILLGLSRFQMDNWLTVPYQMK